MAEKQTVIGPGTQVVGEIRGDESLVVKGRVEGVINLDNELIVDVGGIVKADVRVQNATVSGVVVGSITASEVVHLTSKAKVVGNIHAPRVAIDAGAAYKGRLDMGEVDLGAVPAQKSAVARSSVSATTVAPAAKTAPAAKSPARVVAVPKRAAAKGKGPAWAKKKANKKR